MFSEMARAASAQAPDPITEAMRGRRSPVPSGPAYILGIDLAQAQDYTALCVVEQREIPRPDDPARKVRDYSVRHLRRWRLGTPYTDIVADVAEFTARPPLPGSPMAVDATGVGRAVVDMFRHARLPVTVVPISIHAGHAASIQEDGSYRVPKVDLVSTMQAIVQADRFHIAPALPDAETLGRELQHFTAKVNLTTGNETLEAWRARDHDDLVLSCALAIWFGERGQRRFWIGI